MVRFSGSIIDSIKLELSEKDKIIRNKYMGYAFVAELDRVKYYLIGDFFDDFDEILKMFKGWIVRIWELWKEKPSR